MLAWLAYILMLLRIVPLPCAFLIREGGHIKKESDGRVCFRPHRTYLDYVNRCNS